MPTKTTQIQDAIIAARLSHRETSDLIAFLTGVYQSTVAHAEALADALGDDKSSLSTHDWSASHYGRSELVTAAKSMLASASHFSKGTRGRV